MKFVFPSARKACSLSSEENPILTKGIFINNLARLHVLNIAHIEPVLDRVHFSNRLPGQIHLDNIKCLGVAVVHRIRRARQDDSRDAVKIPEMLHQAALINLSCRDRRRNRKHRNEGQRDGEEEVVGRRNESEDKSMGLWS